MLQVFAESQLGPRGPVRDDFHTKLIHWRDARLALGPSELVGVTGSPRRKRLRRQAAEELGGLSALISTLIGETMILRLRDGVVGRITGSEDGVEFGPEGDHLVRFLNMPVVNPDYPFLLPLRLTLARLPHIREIEVVAGPTDIQGLYPYLLAA